MERESTVFKLFSFTDNCDQNYFFDIRSCHHQHINMIQSLWLLITFITIGLIQLAMSYKKGWFDG